MTVIVTKDAINLREKLSELDKETGIKGEELMRTDTTADAINALQLDQHLFIDFESTGIDDNAASTAVTIDSSNNVGIGTASPNWALQTGNLRGSSTAPSFAGTGDGFAIDVYNEPNPYERHISLAALGAGTTVADMSFYVDNGSAAVKAMTIDSSGNLLVGTTSSSSNTAGIKLSPTGTASFVRSGVQPLYVNRLTSDGDLAVFAKDGTAVGSIGTTTGNLTVYSSAAGKHGLGFYTGAVYSVNNTGALVDNAVDLGNAIYRFKDIYASNGTIQTSDANEKQDVDVLSDAEQRVAVACKGLLRKFRWKDAVEEKGEDARIHFGIIAQDLQAAFTAEGLDAGRYAMFIQNTWTDEETGEEHSRMGVRYSELLAFIIAA